jgi:hypothetical protein
MSMTSLHRLLAALLVLSPSLAANAEIIALDGGGLTLSGYTASDWWYGCGPTTGAMWLAYYDTNGYMGMDFSNLVLGEAGSYVHGAYTGQSLRRLIASEEHQRDYYNAGVYGYNTGGGGYYDSELVWHSYGYIESGDDSTTSSHVDNCLADYMGSSRDMYGLANGGTYAIYDDQGGRLYGASLIDCGGELLPSLLYGVGTHVINSGYQVAWCYSQYTDIQMQADSLTGGFTYADYVAEIDAGRPVALHYFTPDVGGHFMLGIGYDDATGSVVCLNTMNDTLETIQWDEPFQGMDLHGARAMELALVPEPATFALLAGVLGLCMASMNKRRKASTAA